MPTTWNPADKSAGISLTGGNLVATGTDFVNGGTRGTVSITSGKAYFEITHVSTGFSDAFTGVATASKVLNEGGGVNCALVNAWGGNIFVNTFNTSVANIGDFASGDVLCVALDMGAKKIWLRRNSGLWNGSGTANPVTNTDGLDVSALFTSAAAYPWTNLAHTNRSNTLNAGASAFVQVIPSNFLAWNSFDPSIAQGGTAAVGGYTGGVSGASRGRMIRRYRKRNEDEDDENDKRDDLRQLLEPEPAPQVRIGRQRY